jgi:hypothetical protein
MAKKKSAMPAEALEFFRKTGAQGGRAKVPKGFATMSPEKRAKALAAALKARRKNAKARKAAS